MEVTFLSMLFFFVHVSLEPLVGDLQHLLPLAGSYFHCIQVFETSWRNDLIACFSLNFLCTSGTRTDSGPTDGDNDEGDDDEHVHHLLDTGEERLGTTPGHHFFFFIFESTVPPPPPETSITGGTTTALATFTNSKIWCNLWEHHPSRFSHPEPLWETNDPVQTPPSPPHSFWVLVLLIGYFILKPHMVKSSKIWIAQSFWYLVFTAIKLEDETLDS